MSDIKFIYFQRCACNGKAARANDEIEIIRHTNGVSKRINQIRLNRYISDMIFEKGCSRVCIGYNNLTGQNYLVINDDEKGLSLKKQYKNTKCLYITARQMVEYIAKEFGLEGDGEWVIKISDNLSRTPDVVTIELKKPDSKNIQ